jgi:hypothetical protein
MKRRTAALGAIIVLAVAGKAAPADVIMPESARLFDLGGSPRTYRWDFDAQLAAGATLVSGDYFVIYDFGYYTPGSAQTIFNMTPGTWTVDDMSNSQPAPPGTGSPANNPAIRDLKCTYSGPQITGLVSPLVTISAESASNVSASAVWGYNDQNGGASGLVSIVAPMEGPGSTQGNPLLPVNSSSQYWFTGAHSGYWFDPPAAAGFDYAMTGSAKFTDILAFPTGIDADGMFEVWVGSTDLGAFQVSDSVDFVTLLGHGVSSFRITGIDPAVDGGDPQAFPIQLAFDTATADFTMTPVEVPEPATIVWMGVAAVVIFVRRRGPAG